MINDIYLNLDLFKRNESSNEHQKHQCTHDVSEREEEIEGNHFVCVCVHAGWLDGTEKRSKIKKYCERIMNASKHNDTLNHILFILIHNTFLLSLARTQTQFIFMSSLLQRIAICVKTIMMFSEERALRLRESERETE
jgi:hypothetical protein